MSNSSSTQSITEFWAIITESKRIISSHSRHFLALSVAFLLPLAFSATVFPTLTSSFHSTNHIQSLLQNPPSHILTPFLLLSDGLTITKNNGLHPSFHNPNFYNDYNNINNKTLILSLLFFSFFLFFSLLGVSAVTNSVYRGFYGRPVKFFGSISSLFKSFLPLLVTFIGTQVVVFVVVGCFVVFGYLGISVIELIVGEDGISFDSRWFIGVCLIGGVLLAFVLINLCVNWILAGVVVIVEGKWGFDALIRSKSLMRGMRWVGLMLIIFFGFFEGVLVWLSMVSGVDEYSGSVSNGWNIFGFVLWIVATCAVLTVLLLHSIAALTVMYMYCKALHGELAGEIVHEFATEYVCLPFDEQKLPHVVCYVN